MLFRDKENRGCSATDQRVSLEKIEKKYKGIQRVDRFRLRSYTCWIDHATGSSTQNDSKEKSIGIRRTMTATEETEPLISSRVLTKCGNNQQATISYDAIDLVGKQY